MSGETFDAAWLELREAVDHRSRAHGLTQALADWWEERGGSTVLDLGSGTGSNLRYLAPRLAGRQEWTLVDHDAGLLERALGGGEAGEAGAVGPLTRVMDNGEAEAVERAPREPARAVGQPVDEVTVRAEVRDLADVGPRDVATADLVTASALLDLVPDAWLNELAHACVEARCGALFALTYDGTIAWGAEHPADALVVAAVNAHQRGDKGLGPALGPAAGAAAADAFRGLGCETHVSASPWRLGPADAALAHALVEGWAVAAAEERPAEAALVKRWSETRLAAIAGGDFTLTVGHVDVLALPRSPAR